MRTLGVEEEFLIVDPRNGSPLPIAGEILHLHDLSRSAEDPPSYPMLAAELQQEQLEVITGPHSRLSGLAAEIRAGRSYADALARKAGARISALATSPLPVTPRHTRNDRYDALLEKFALTAREQLTCGYHVHVSVGSDEEGVAILDRIRSWLPPLIALSSNSPFWNGTDTGYSSFRTQAWNRWSTAGPTDVFGSADAYHSFVERLSGTGVVASPDFDARLSARHPTVEIRVSDVCLDVRDATLIAALVRALVETASREWEAGQPPDNVATAILRQGVWLASRFGIEGNLLHPVAHKPDTAGNVVAALYDHVRDSLDQTGDAAYVEASLQRILDQGTGATRQRQSYERNNSLADVVAHATGVTHEEADHRDPRGEQLLAKSGTTSRRSDLVTLSG
ncbi:carboxylate-amine ligase [Arthrobacter oryzae]|uniref:carboxylate-amine ligase n=1 Tax=Arthrobacter oryzae TaxID=409290 RepID=UPI00277FA1D5|nr:glutamate--cysteine ligase [Arthrobacter oryzae]MDQ0075590.1 carboxylate-amine ligase [Arthrobacter oryzae]